MESIIPRIVADLEALGVPRADAIDESRLQKISNGLAHYNAEQTAAPAPAQTPVETPAPAPAAPAAPAESKWGLSALLSVIVVALLAAGGYWFSQRQSTGAKVETETQASAPSVAQPNTVDLRPNLIMLNDLDGHYIAVVPYWHKKQAEYFLFLR